MSDVLIKRMEMPVSCFACSFRRKVDPDNIMCIVTREVFEETFAGTIETRNRGNCPLVPVPEHGRLIDADALRLSHCAECIMMGRTCDGKDPDCWSDPIYHIDHAPTIIEANGSEEVDDE